MGKDLSSVVIPFLLAICAIHAETRAHHKVHNLALYPERHSWCQVTPIKQEISFSPECQSTTIDNNVCLGACFSYSVPKAQDDPVIPPYCDACRPTLSAWKVVTLNCTKPTTGEPYNAVRNVEIISNCSCVDCNDNKPRKEQPDESDSPEEEDSSSEVPDEEANEVDNADGGEGGKLLQLPTLRKLKSVSSESKTFHIPNAEEIMIQNNKIPEDDLPEDESLRASRVNQE